MKEIKSDMKIEKLFSVEDKIVVITGAGGLAVHLGKAFLENGSTVVFTGRNKGKLDKISSDLKEKGYERFSVFCMDQSNADEVDSCFKAIADKFGRIDVMINTAAIAPNDSAESFESGAVKEIIDIDLLGAIYVTQAAGRIMINQKNGKIINIGSIAGVECHSYESMPYETAKAGVHQMTKSCAIAWGKYNINVNCIAPTWIDSPMLEDLPQSYFDAVNDMHEFGRMSVVDDYVGAAIYLASDASAFVSGHTLLVDGGWCAGRPIKY